MNKAELTEYLANDLATSKTETERFLNAFLGAIHKNIRKEKIKIAGLGTFCAIKRKARVGRNPKTGEELKIPPKWVPKFKPGNSLKETAKKEVAKRK
jgi:DNA-binding protein HU-beta